MESAPKLETESPEQQKHEVMRKVETMRDRLDQLFELENKTPEQIELLDKMITNANTVFDEIGQSDEWQNSLKMDQ